MVVRFQQRLAAAPTWALYRVRRAWAGERTTYRSIEVMARGGRAGLEAQLAETGPVERDGYGLLIRVRLPRPEGAGREERYAVLPAVVEEKQHPLHPLWWRRLRALERAGKALGDVDFVMACAAEVRAQWGFIVPSKKRLVGMYGQRYMQSEITAASQLLRGTPHAVVEGAHLWWSQRPQTEFDFAG